MVLISQKWNTWVCKENHSVLKGFWWNQLPLRAEGGVQGCMRTQWRSWEELFGNLNSLTGTFSMCYFFLIFHADTLLHLLVPAKLAAESGFSPGELSAWYNDGEVLSELGVLLSPEMCFLKYKLKLNNWFLIVDGPQRVTGLPGSSVIFTIVTSGRDALAHMLSACDM